MSTREKAVKALQRLIDQCAPDRAVSDLLSDAEEAMTHVFKNAKKRDVAYAADWSTEVLGNANAVFELTSLVYPQGDNYSEWPLCIKRTRKFLNMIRHMGMFCRAMSL